MDEKETQKPSKNEKTVVFSPKPKAGLFHRLLSNRKRKTIVLICVLIAIAIAASVYLLFIQEKAVVTVAGKNIYKSDILKEESLYKKAWSAVQGEKNKQDNYEVAKKQLTIEAIIIAEAKKRGITLSQQEINQEYKIRSSGYTTEKQFLGMLTSTYGWSKDDLLSKINQDLLQSKLENLVVKGYNGTVVYVRYDIYKDNQNLVDVARAKADQIDSQLKNGAKVSDILKTYENDPTWGHPFLGSFEYSDVNASNEKANFEGREDWQNISGLTKSGDVSGVYKSGGGYFGIAILSNKTSGTYDSWDAFINTMMKSSVSVNSTIKTKVIAIFTEISKDISASFSSIYKQLASILIPPKAGAVDCGGSGCLNPKGDCCVIKNGCTLGHMATVKVTVKDSVTRLPIRGATITMQYNGQNYSNLCPSQIDASKFTEITNSNGVANFYLSCWIHYTIKFSHPDYENTTIDDNYKPDNGATTKEYGVGTRKQWTLVGQSLVSLNGGSKVQTLSVARGTNVTFEHSVWNGGPNNFDSYYSKAHSTVHWTEGKSGKVFSDDPADHDPLQAVGDYWHYAWKRENAFTVPSSATGGTRYCQNITFSPLHNDGGVDSSTSACVTVSQVWTITAGISIGKPTAQPGDITAQPGDIIHWYHSIYNEGPDATSNVNYSGGSGTGGAGSFSGLVSHGTKNVPTSTPYTVSQNDVGLNLCRSTVASPKAWNDTGSTTAGPACAFIPYNYVLTPNIGLNVSGAIEPGSSVNVTPGFTVPPPNNITKSKSTNWQLTQMIVNTTATVPHLNSTGSSADAPCVTYFTGSGVACSTLPGGGSGVTVFSETGTWLSGSTLATVAATIGNDYPAGTKICYAFSLQPHSNSDNQWIHTAPACLYIGKRPKTQIWAGDLLVGVNVTTSTSTRNGNTYGSWAEYGIIASGGINGAASGAAFAGPTGYSGVSTSACDYSKLSFTSAGSSTCVNPIGKYTNAANMPEVAASFPGGSPITVPAISPNALDGIYTVAGDLILNPGINLNKSVIIKATGTVTIKGDQTYADGPYTDVNQLPQLVIIANKIIINSDVQRDIQRVDAWLVATNSAGSSIYTCDAQVASTLTCPKKLVVNGPVMTNHLYLWRTYGSDTATLSEPAEVFNLRADAYLWAIAHASAKSYIQTVYNTELPPRL